MIRNTLKKIIKRTKTRHSRLLNPFTNPLNSSKLLITPHSHLKFNFSSILKGKGSEMDLEIFQMIYEHKMKMNMYKKESTRMEVNEDCVKEIPTPNFLGKIGVSLNELRYFELVYEESRAQKSHDVNFPSSSWLRVVFPFKDKPELREDLVTPKGEKMRIGRLLEIMDFMAGRVCYKHCDSEMRKDSNNITIVTASCDHIEFYPVEVCIDSNVILEAYITFTGRSSMEVRLDVTNSKNQLYCSAYYLMVARDNETQKAAKVPSIQPESIPGQDPITSSQSSKLRLNLGERRQRERKQLRNTSIYKTPPNSEESKHLHEIFLNTIDDRVEELVIDLGSTRVEKTVLKHIQDRNIHGKIFGGLVMRQSLELAFVCAYQAGKGSYPKIYHIDDIHFIVPIDVGKIIFLKKILGSVIRYEAYMTYTQGRVANVKVIVSKVVSKDNKMWNQKAFEFNIDFLLDKEMPPVRPSTYEEAMIYLEGKRRVEKILQE